MILVGGEGSGKGTQAEMLSETLGIPHLASGDLFRKAIDEKTELGLKVKVYMDRGELVPDDLTVVMVLGRLAMPDCSRRVLLAGFPRTVAQAPDLHNAVLKAARHTDTA